MPIYQADLPIESAVMSSIAMFKVFSNLKSLKWQIWTFLNGKWRKVQCQTFNVWSSKAASIFTCSRTNYGAWVPCGMWKFYIPIKISQWGFDSCRWGTDVSSMSIHLSIQLIEKKLISCAMLWCGAGSWRSMVVCFVVHSCFNGMIWYHMYLLLFSLLIPWF